MLSRVRNLPARSSHRVISTIRVPVRRARRSRRASPANTVAAPGRDRPKASTIQLIVIAVPIMLHMPGLAHASDSISQNAPASMRPEAYAPIASLMSDATQALSPTFLGSIGPPVSTIVGISHRAAAINIPGTTLSHEQSIAIPSKRCASIIASTESAMISRLGRM